MTFQAVPDIMTCQAVPELIFQVVPDIMTWQVVPDIMTCQAVPDIICQAVPEFKCSRQTNMSGNLM
jgi:hypothetical protein